MKTSKAAKKYRTIVSLLGRLDELTQDFGLSGPDPVPFLHRLAFVLLAINPGGIHGGSSGEPGSSAADALDGKIGDLIDFLNQNQDKAGQTQGKPAPSKGRGGSGPPKPQPGGSGGGSGSGMSPKKGRPAVPLHK
jgi:hypothetical protein